MSRYFSASAIQPPLRIRSVWLAGMLVDDRFAKYYMSFYIAMSTPNPVQDVSVASVADDVIWSSMCAVSCVYINFPEGPGSSKYSFFTSRHWRVCVRESILVA